jgi:flagellar hook-basal body complex protein FliE
LIPIDPSLALGGTEWQVGGIAPVDAAAAPAEGGGGFGGMLTEAVSKLEGLQTTAAEASQALATGTATDVSAVVNAVEHARLGMQLASQIRNKAVEAYTDIFHTQV